MGFAGVTNESMNETTSTSVVSGRSELKGRGDTNEKSSRGGEGGGRVGGGVGGGHHGREMKIQIESENVAYVRGEDASGGVEYIQSTYVYERSVVEKTLDGKFKVKPCKEEYVLKTDVMAKPTRYEHEVQMQSDSDRDGEMEDCDRTQRSREMDFRRENSQFTHTPPYEYEEEGEGSE